MITAVVYSESGGTFKTTTTANLAVAFERMGLDTLVIDLDPQKGNLSSLFEVGARRDDPQADSLVKHILEMPDGDFSDLIETSAEGVDVIPGHDMLSDFTSNLEQKITYETGMQNMTREEYPRYELLYKLLWNREELQNEYDAILVDPNARAEDLLYNAIYALRTIVAPVKPAGKGNLSLDGLDELVENLGDRLDIDIGLSCVVPCAVKRTNAHRHYQQQFEADSDFATPVTIGDRESLMDDMWGAHGSAFKVVEEQWMTTEVDDGSVFQSGSRGVRDREVDTLADLYRLAHFIATETFDMDVDSVLELDIDGHGVREFDVTAADEEVVDA